VTLFDLGTVDRGRSRHRPRHEPALYGGPYPFIQTGDIKASEGRITAHSQTYNELGLSQSRLWPAGTMCITIAANIAETAILTYPACFPDSVIGFIPDPLKADVYFVEYAFRNLKRRIQAITEDSGTVQDNINLEFLRHLQFPVPNSVSEQGAIREVFGALDDRIHLNHKMNRVLEATASALFRAWFIEFDPVTAKVEGRKPYGMNDEIAALFPSEFENGIPSGWKPSPLDDLVNIVMGQSPPGKSYNEHGQGMPFFQGRTDYGFRYPEKRIYTTLPGRIAQTRDVLVSVRAPVGDVNVAVETCCIGRGLAAVRSKTNKQSFALYLMKALASEFDTFEGEGTVFGAITGPNFRRISFPALPPPLINEFDALASSFDERIELNERQSKILGKLRDVLLPRLISGELRLKEVEQQVEAALS